MPIFFPGLNYLSVFPWLDAQFDVRVWDVGLAVVKAGLPCQVLSYAGEGTVAAQHEVELLLHVLSVAKKENCHHIFPEKRMNK